MKETYERSMRLFELMDKIRRSWCEFAPRPELTKAQFGTLLVIQSGSMVQSHPVKDDPFEPMTFSELSAIMEQSMPAVSQRISKLETLGYVRRIPDEKDRRTIWIQLTSSGKELLDSCRQSMEEYLEYIRMQMGDEDAETMFRILEKLSVIMEQTNKKRG